MEGPNRAYRMFLDEFENARKDGKDTDARVELRTVDGKGVCCYATQYIKKDDIVCFYTGMYVPSKLIISEKQKPDAPIFEHVGSWNHPEHAPIRLGDLDFLAYCIDARNFAVLYRDNIDTAKKHVWACGGMINSSRADGDIENPGDANIKISSDKTASFLISIYAECNVGKQRPLECVVGYAAAPMTATRNISAGDEVLLNYSWKPTYDVRKAEVFRYVRTDAHQYGIF